MAVHAEPLAPAEVPASAPHRRPSRACAPTVPPGRSVGGADASPAVLLVDCQLEALEGRGAWSPQIVDRAHVVMLGRGRSYRQDPSAGPASIDAILKGEGRWETDRQRYLVRPGAILVLDEGDVRALAIDSHTPVETLSILFRTGFLSTLACERRWDAATVLDHPDGAAAEEPQLLRGLYPVPDVVETALERVRLLAASGIAASDMEEGVLELGYALLGVGDEYWARSSRVRATHASTRAEILRRVATGRDFIESHLADSLALRDISRAAAMSMFHFHRCFRQVFGETPHQYATRRRLELARRLLASSDMPIADVAVRTGFGSPTAFSTVFRRHVACRPTAFRRALRPVRAASTGRRRSTV